MLRVHDDHVWTHGSRRRVAPIMITFHDHPTPAYTLPPFLHICIPNSSLHLLTQFFNAIYVLNADASSPSSIHIYDAKAKSWSTQSVGLGDPSAGQTFDPTPGSYGAILDHDTNVFCESRSCAIFSFLRSNVLTHIHTHQTHSPPARSSSSTWTPSPPPALLRSPGPSSARRALRRRAMSLLWLLRRIMCILWAGWG